ncbi:hypothetical protein ACN47E_002968 [Coniothyrium glycines]
MAFTTEAARWRALVTRDADANGHFIYSVKSTKIYCRPACPGRLARRANVGFYETAAQAEAAGFRACKRCKPDTVLECPQEQAVQKACVMIEDALRKDEPETFRLQELAKKVGLTPRYFHRIFKDKTGMTPKEYAKHKSSAKGSSDTASSATEANVQPWEWDTFDFNDLLDYSMYSDQALSSEAAQELLHTFSTDRSFEFEGKGPPEPWCGGMYDAGLCATNLISNSNSTPIFDLTTAFQSQNPTSTVSTFSQDAAVVLGSPVA